jgi:hypothetical protein
VSDDTLEPKRRQSPRKLESKNVLGEDTSRLQREYESAHPPDPIDRVPVDPPEVASALVTVTEGEYDVLARLEDVPRILAEVTDVVQAKETLTAARVIEAYAKGKKLGEEILRLAFRFKALAKRRLGETLRDINLRSGRPRKMVDDDDHFGAASVPTTLKEMGVSKDESAQAQAYAAVPIVRFEELVGSVGLSDTALLRAVNESKQGVAATHKEQKTPRVVRKQAATELAPAEPASEEARAEKAAAAEASDCFQQAALLVAEGARLYFAERPDLRPELRAAIAGWFTDTERDLRNFANEIKK